MAGLETPHAALGSFMKRMLPGLILLGCMSGALAQPAGLWSFHAHATLRPAAETPRASVGQENAPATDEPTETAKPSKPARSPSAVPS